MKIYGIREYRLQLVWKIVQTEEEKFAARRRRKRHEYAFCLVVNCVQRTNVKLWSTVRRAILQSCFSQFPLAKCLLHLNFAPFRVPSVTVKVYHYSTFACVLLSANSVIISLKFFFQSKKANTKQQAFNTPFKHSYHHRNSNYCI